MRRFEADTGGEDLAGEVSVFLFDDNRGVEMVWKGKTNKITP